MNVESLRLIRNILLRSVVVGAVLTLGMQIATVVGWSTWTEIAVKWMHADAVQFSTIVLCFFSAIKFFLLFILLTPGLAIHWTIKRELARIV